MSYQWGKVLWGGGVGDQSEMDRYAQCAMGRENHHGAPRNWGKQSAKGGAYKGVEQGQWTCDRDMGGGGQGVWEQCRKSKGWTVGRWEMWWVWGDVWQFGGPGGQCWKLGKGRGGNFQWNRC